ncbi:hypothetical protein ABZZ80_01120 [Streptomyces sp. NPDC006356]
MRITRKATGTLLVGGALSLTLAALAYPSMLGFGAVAADAGEPQVTLKP